MSKRRPHNWELVQPFCKSVEAIHPGNTGVPKKPCSVDPILVGRIYNESMKVAITRRERLVVSNSNGLNVAVSNRHRARRFQFASNHLDDSQNGLGSATSLAGRRVSIRTLLNDPSDHDEIGLFHASVHRNVDMAGLRNRGVDQQDGEKSGNCEPHGHPFGAGRF